VTLTDGSILSLADEPRVTQIWPGAVTDLAPGQYVAIAGAPGPDGILQASLVAVFPEAARGTGEGQREMNEIRFCEPLCQPRDLMTNAAIDDARLDAVAGGELTISFLGETGQVHLTPDTRIEIQRPGSLA